MLENPWRRSKLAKLRVRSAKYPRLKGWPEKSH
jgi:hypothetical protein